MNSLTYFLFVGLVLVVVARVVASIRSPTPRPYQRHCDDNDNDEWLYLNEDDARRELG